MTQVTRGGTSISGSSRERCPHRRLAMRLLFRPIPRHFSRWGAKREAAILRLQLGQTHSLLFHWLKTCPKMSNPGWSTISGDRRGVAIRAGRGPSPLVSRPWPLETPCLGSQEPQVLRLVQFPEEELASIPGTGAGWLSFNPEAHQNPSCYQGPCRPGRSSHT